MATRGIIAGTVVVALLFTLTAGCTLWTGPSGPPATGTPPAATPASTGAGGAEETPSPLATTAPTTPTPTATAASDEMVATVATTPAPVPTGTGTIAELAAADPELSRFVDALRQGGVYETLNGTGTYTVFAPSNAAFDAVPPGTVARLLFDREALDTVANYHVIYGRWPSADLARETSVATRSGVPLSVTVLADGGLQVDDARVTRSDIVATNGVLHVVDAVMIPPGTL